jgi:hypothetical protein
MAKKAFIYDGSQWVDIAQSTTDLTNYPTLSGFNYGFRNFIINGDFGINQRGLNATGITATAYGLDRWWFSASGVTGTHSAQPFTIGVAPVSGYEAKTFARVVTTGQSAASDLAYLAQRIESVRNLAGQQVTISFWAKAASGTPKISAELNQWFGTGGSSETNTSAGSVTISTSWQRYSMTQFVPSISGKTIGTSDFLNVILWMSAGTSYTARSGAIGIQNNTFDIWGVQVEAGSTATPFEQRPIGTELALCQRYYYRLANGSAQVFGLGWATTTSQLLVHVQFPVTMRTKPTAIETSGTASDYTSWLTNGSGNTLTSVPTWNTNTTPSTAIVQGIAGASFTAGAGTGLLSLTANAYLGWSAEF